MNQAYRPSVDVKLLAKRIGVLFWLIIVSSVAGFFTGNNTNELYGIGWVISTGADLAYGIVLLSLAPEDESYRMSGICVILCTAIGIVSTAMNLGIPGAGIILGMIAVILTAVLDIAGEYYEFKAHAGVMSCVSQLMSDKWNRLWKWRLWTMLGMLAAVIVSILISAIGVLIALIAGIGTLVISIMKIVYLRQTAKILEEYE